MRVEPSAERAGIAQSVRAVACTHAFTLKALVAEATAVEPDADHKFMLPHGLWDWWSGSNSVCFVGRSVSNSAGAAKPDLAPTNVDKADRYEPP